ncbi:MAG: LLM class flavin-dependent oxidoreductase [Gaiellales bacterium]
MEFGVFIGAHNIGHERSESQLYEDITEQVLLADELGYDVVWLAEHHFNDYNLMPDPLQVAVRILERTERIRVGVAVVILRDHHPLQLAGRIAQLDVLYPGRFETAVGRGSSGFEAKRFQREMDIPTSRAHFLEHLQVMVAGWRNDQDWAFDGEFWRFPEVTVLPRPITRPHPSLWLSAVTPQSIHGQVHNCKALGVQPKVFTSPFRNPFSYLRGGIRTVPARPGRDRLPARSGALRGQSHHLRRREPRRGGSGPDRCASHPPRPVRTARGQRAVRQRQDPDQARAARDRR